METKTFYSPAAGLTISPPGMKGKFMNIDGEQKRAGETIIQFVPMGGHRINGVKGGKEYGYYTTADPAEIAYLERRALELGDVFGPEEYNKQTTPPQIRAEQASRVIEDQNRLIADLQAQLHSHGTADKPVQAPTK